MSREMKDSGIEWIGEIPQTWNVAKCKYFLSIKSGDAIRNEDLSDDKMYDVYGGGEKIGTYNNYNVDKNNLLIGRVGARCGCITQIENNAWATDNALIVTTACNIKYMFYLLSHLDLNRLNTSNAQPLITSSKIYNCVSAYVSDIYEQNQIAAHLDIECAKIDDVITKTKATIEEYKKLKQSVITEAVTKGIRPNREMKDSGIEWIGEIPREWEIIISRFVIDSVSDVDHNMPESVEKGIPYVMTGDLKELASEIDFNNCKQISNDDYYVLAAKSFAEYGDVIFARYATIGTVCYVDINTDFIVSYSCVTVKPKRNTLNGKFLFYYFKSETFLEDVKQYIVSNTQSNIGIEALYKTKIVVPTIEEQQEIADYLDKKCSEIDTLIAKKEQIVTELESYKKSLIYEYVTGKKEVV